MSTTLNQKSLCSSLFTWWMEEFPEEIPTLFPGMDIDTGPLSEWVELHIDSWTPALRRRTQTELLESVLTIHCFTKHSTAPARIQEAAQEVKSLVTHAVIPIFDEENSETPVIGYGMFWEPELRTLTRTHRAALQLNLHHQVVTIRGVAQRFTIG